MQRTLSEGSPRDGPQPAWEGQGGLVRTSDTQCESGWVAQFHQDGRGEGTTPATADLPPPRRHSFPARLTSALPSLWLTVKLGLCQQVVPLGLCRVAAQRLGSAETWAIVEPRKARAVHSRRAAWWDFHLKSATASGCLPPPGPAPALQQFLFVPVGLGFCWLELRCDG